MTDRICIRERLLLQHVSTMPEAACLQVLTWLATNNPTGLMRALDAVDDMADLDQPV